MLIVNAKIFTPQGWCPGGLSVKNGRFEEILPGLTQGGDLNLGGDALLPGLIDLHTHGYSGADFSDGDVSGLRLMARALAKHGVTGFLPTSMSLPYERLAAAFASAAELSHAPEPGEARVLGIHMEGPFFSEKKKGAQNAAYLRAPDLDTFIKLYEGCDGLIHLVDLAPELPGAISFTERAKDLCTVSVAHTNASYDEAAAVFQAGARHLTHLFNAMPPIHHRSPGVIGAASERDEVCAELICDGHHVHPSAVRMAFRLFPGRICLISDALRCCGLDEGDYELGDQQVRLENGVARLPNGNIAGSATDLYACMVKAVSFGIPKEEAIRAATIVPARQIGLEKELGSIEAGKMADFIRCDADLNLKQVYLDGEPI